MTRRAEIDWTSVAEILDLALAEDSVTADVTTRSLFGETDTLSGTIVARSAGVLAGLPVAGAVFARLDGGFRLTEILRDGDRLGPGRAVARCEGRAWALLSGERVALNFLQRLSGVATLTARYVERARASGARILDTRKTTPGMRALEKYAVRVGGGDNHRFSLEDMVLIKDNHVEVSGSIRAAVERVRRGTAHKLVEVEIQDFEQLAEVLPLEVDRIMLDNFEIAELQRAVETVRAYPGRRPEVEVSGGITLETVGEVAATGVDFISVGALTHSAPAVDLSMEIGS